MIKRKKMPFLIQFYTFLITQMCNKDYKECKKNSQ